LGTFYVYILKSKSDDRYYIGQTSNLRERVSKHNRGQVKSTKSRIPLDLIYFEEFKTRREAMHREWYLKSKDGISEKYHILSQQ
jgi:putative endonuclease